MGVAGGCVCLYVWGAQELPVDCSRLSGEYIEKHTHTHTSKGALHIVVPLRIRRMHNVRSKLCSNIFIS